MPIFFFITIVILILYFINSNKKQIDDSGFTDGIAISKILELEQAFQRVSARDTSFVVKDSIMQLILNVIGTDEAGRKLYFDIAIIARDHYWHLGSHNVDSIIADLPFDNLEDYLIQSVFFERMAVSSKIVCIGVSSYELEDDSVQGSTLTDILSLKRAQNLAKTIDHAMAFVKGDDLRSKISTIPIYVVALGKHTIHDKQFSNLQRSVIVLSIIKEDSQINMDQAIHNGILKLGNSMPVNILNYEWGRIDQFKIQKYLN